VFKGYKPAPFFFVASIVSKIIPIKIRKIWIFKSKKLGKFGLILRALVGCKESMEKLLMGFGSDDLASLTSSKSNKNNEQTLRILTGSEIKIFYDNDLDIRLKNVFMRKSDHASMKASKELRSPYLQNDVNDFTRMNNFFSNLIPKLKLKIYLLDSIDFLGVFRKKVGFDMVSIHTQNTRKEDILVWCHNNRDVVDSLFIFDRFVSLVKAARKESHLFRIEVFLMWAKGLDERKE